MPILSQNNYIMRKQLSILVCCLLFIPAWLSAADAKIKGHFSLEGAHPSLITGTIEWITYDFGHKDFIVEGEMQAGNFEISLPVEGFRTGYVKFRGQYVQALAVAEGQTLEVDWKIDLLGEETFSFVHPESVHPLTLHYAKHYDFLYGDALKATGDQDPERLIDQGRWEDFQRLAESNRLKRLTLLNEYQDRYQLPEAYVNYCRWEIALRAQSSLLSFQNFSAKRKPGFVSEFQPLPINLGTPIPSQLDASPEASNYALVITQWMDLNHPNKLHNAYQQTMEFALTGMEAGFMYRYMLSHSWNREEMTDLQPEIEALRDLDPETWEVLQSRK